MSAPERVQLSRAKGWRKPEGAVVVARPTRWGNPFTVEEFGPHEAVRRYEQMIRWKLAEDPHLLDELRGRDLCCWCKPDQPCHADVLLKLANPPRATSAEDLIDVAAEALGVYLLPWQKDLAVRFMAGERFMVRGSQRSGWATTKAVVREAIRMSGEGDG